MNYKEDQIMSDVFNYIKTTYGEHYATDPNGVQLFDLWHANNTLSVLGVGTAQKYLTRYGKKEGFNKRDLFKAMHYIVLALYHDHYSDEEQAVGGDDQSPPPGSGTLQAVPIDLTSMIRDAMERYQQEQQNAGSQ